MSEESMELKCFFMQEQKKWKMKEAEKRPDCEREREQAFYFRDPRTTPRGKCSIQTLGEASGSSR